MAGTDHGAVEKKDGVKETAPVATRAQPSQTGRIRFDYQNLLVYHNASADSIELLVTVPLTDGVGAEARITLANPVKVPRDDGQVEYKVDMNGGLATSGRRTSVGSATGSGEVEAQSRDGLHWEIPEGYPGAWTALLEHEPRVKEFLSSQFTPGHVFVDVGANVGAYSLRAASKGMKVISFEPNPENAKLLMRNAELNSLSVDLHECALGRSEGKVLLSHTGATSRVSRMERADEEGPVQRENGIEATLSTLDSFDLPKVDLMKIDVEGYELDVLEGAKKTLERCRPNMMIEMHHWLGAEKEAALFRILTDIGYRFEYLDRYALGRHLAVVASR